MTKLLLATLLSLNSYAASSAPSTCGACSILEKQEVVFNRYANAYEALTIDSEKYAAETKLLAQMGRAANALIPILSVPKLTNEVLLAATELLVKINFYDNDNIILGNLKETLTPYIKVFEIDSAALLKNKKITLKEYKYFIDTLTSLAEDEEDDSQ